MSSRSDGPSDSGTAFGVGRRPTRARRSARGVPYWAFGTGRRSVRAGVRYGPAFGPGSEYGAGRDPERELDR
jgi:hypothetical protein